MSIIRSFLLFILASCATHQANPPTILEIIELRPDNLSHLTSQNLVHLTKVYDLKPFLYANKVHIKSGVPARHHPVITLNTRFAREPNKLLSSLMHEQFHWWLGKNKMKSIMAVKHLRKEYPREKDHLHLLVCYLEFRSLSHFLGKNKARQIFTDFVNKDKIFPWHNYQVLYRDQIIKKVVEEQKLLPKGL